MACNGIKIKTLQLLCLCFFGKVISDDSYADYIYKVSCKKKYVPRNCNYPNTTLENIVTVEDLERCGPSLLPLPVRNYYWGAAGRKVTYKNNFIDLKKTNIVPRILRDVSKNHINTTLLGMDVKFPLGLSPTAAHKLAHPDGELATARAAAAQGIVMILSSISQSRLEDVAKAAFSVDTDAILWMQTYIFKNRHETLDLIQRAEKAKFKALTVTIDSPAIAVTSCNLDDITEEIKVVNLFNESFEGDKIDPSITFEDLKWLVKSTNLPVVAKGVTTGDDAIRVAETGVSAILVSNHGGRQLDNERSTIESLREVSTALSKDYTNVEIYMDGGIRNGWDVFKVLAAGAKSAFVGRPVLWGLAIDGENGVNKMLSIFKTEFHEAMLTAGYASPEEIYEERIIRQEKDTKCSYGGSV